ncbi:Bromodomain containing protein [Trichomonas vaginalis G3]|uniref:Bromodomain containing protein n=1 Tax=Trichomonas vaginalis (strain ATCC PRA-98 / G3) TaxID=412133 RepID=A2E2L6_TRIV3|nr:acetylation-dependent protein binding [Trichomonas vaginalis G3]EAY13044.1 Bromodomain containing protein [Trichomonas vaginalis G3]KAI5548233.1 acetylation-dependent protein binding [Trichomonas vaginalis G3]|eukprot:XP_001325267.1 Bromodomain containing protein [Trichomonas vaginalis G3]
MNFCENTRQKCIEIIDNLMKHPIAEIFINPIDPELDNVPNYFEIIKKPMDLSTVKKNLQDGTYTNFNDFKKDVEQIWGNASLFNGRPSLPSMMADELARIFKKLVSPIESLGREEWIAAYSKSQAHLYKLFRAQPKQLEQFNLSPDTEMLVPERRLARSFLQAEDTKLFQEAFRFIHDPAHLSKLKQIITENEPSVDPTEEELHINLSALTQKTLKLLRAFAIEMKEVQMRQPMLE